MSESQGGNGKPKLEGVSSLVEQKRQIIVWQRFCEPARLRIAYWLTAECRVNLFLAIYVTNLQFWEPESVAARHFAN